MRFIPTVRTAALMGAVLLGAAGCAAPPADPLSYVIFFTAQSAALDTPAGGVVTEAATAAKAAPGRPITVEGYADMAGTPQANQILSRLRAQVVADGLVERGVDRSRIQLRPKGATGGDPGIESRRVEINIR